MIEGHVLRACDVVGRTKQEGRGLGRGSERVSERGRNPRQFIVPVCPNQHNHDSNESYIQDQTYVLLSRSILQQ